MNHQKYIIEARDASGKLLPSTYPHPESVFGAGAISGLTDWQMSRTIFARKPGAVLTGDNIPNWPRLINPQWVARRKTW